MRLMALQRIREQISQQDRLAKAATDVATAAAHAGLAQYYRDELRTLHQRIADDRENPRAEPPADDERAAEQRLFPRESLFLGADVKRSGDVVTGRLRNISRTGAFVELSPVPGVGESIMLSFRGIPCIEAVVVRRTFKGVGVRFAQPIDPGACRNNVRPRPADWTKDYVLCLREGICEKLWQGNVNHRRPRLRP